MEIVDNRLSTRPFCQSSSQNPRVVVSDDAIRLAITGDRFNSFAESQVYAIKYAMIRTLLLQGYDVLVDDTHTSETSIRRLLEIDIDAQFCFVNTGIRTCIDRAKQTNQEDLKSVIWRQAINLHKLIRLPRNDMIVTMKNIKSEQLYNEINNIIQDVVAKNEHKKKV